MSRRLRDAVLLAALAGASAVFALEIARLGEPAPLELGPPSGAAQPAADAFALDLPPPVPLAELAAALERPLFTQSRRPPAAPVAAPSQLDAVLAGVLSDGAEKVAIVVAPGADRALRLREGDVFQGWRVERVEDEAVVLERDGRTERLVLTFRGPPPATQAGPGRR